MKFKDKLFAGLAVLRAKIFKKKTPLIVGWAITSECNSRCGYCGYYEKSAQELTTDQALGVIEEMAGLGTKIISFTGGEPLVREDLGKLIDKAAGLGMDVRVNSNGWLVPEKIGLLKKIKKLNLSFDGPEDTNDSIRGKGCFSAVMRAADIAGREGIKVDFCCVISNKNIGSLEFVLKKAKEYNADILFQAATQNILGKTEENELSPTREEFGKAIDELLKLKKTHKNILNSEANLKFMKTWTGGSPLKCASSFISCRIEPNGDVVHCSRETFDFKPLNIVRDGFKKAFYNLPDVCCSKCFCAGRLELNCLLDLNIGSIRKAIRGI